jgi:hypothetical protein
MYHSKLSAVLLIVLIALSLCNGTAIHPKSLQTQSGTTSTTALSALNTQDQSGSQDNWNKYVEFYGHQSAYKGVFSFDVSGIDASSVSTYTMDVSWRGPQHSTQVWEFEYFVPASNSWVLAGDNTDAANWAWSELSFCNTEAFADLVSGGVIKVRYSSATVADDSDIDYLAITVTAGSASTGSATSTHAPATPAPTHKATQAPTPTHAPATPAPTHKATQAPNTPRPTPKATPTHAPSTPAPTHKATQAPTPKATPAPNATPAPKATPKPTAKATSKPTTTPNAPGGRMCPAGEVWAPAPGTTWQWQLTGTVDTSLDVQMYDIDLFDNTAQTIATLHSQGKAVICYFSTQYENWRPDASSWPASVIGSGLDGWPGENYVDIRSPIVRSIMQTRLDLAVSKGCDGVEPDNVDEYTNSNGLGITAADQIDFNTFIATEAHARGLSVGLKNDLDQVATLQPHFDWVLDEQCNQYSECDMLEPFVKAGKAAFGVEYSGSASNFCPKMVTDGYSWLLKDLDLTAKVTQCCTYASGGCATKPASRCINYNAKRDELPAEEEAFVDEQVAEDQLLAADEYFSSASTVFPATIVVVAVIALVL